MFDENKSLAGFNLRHLMYQQDGAEHVKQTVSKVFQLFQEGKIKPLLDSTWALEDVSIHIIVFLIKFAVYNFDKEVFLSSGNIVYQL